MGLQIYGELELQPPIIGVMGPYFWLVTGPISYILAAYSHGAVYSTGNLPEETPRQHLPKKKIEVGQSKYSENGPILGSDDSSTWMSPKKKVRINGLWLYPT